MEEEDHAVEGGEDVVMAAEGEDEAGEDGADEEEAEAADLSLCDASFSAADSVATSDHDRISKCTEEVSQFLACVRDHHSRVEEFDFEASLGILTAGELEALWASLLGYLQASCSPCQDLVAGVALVGRLSIQLEAEAPPPPLLEAARLVGALLPSLGARTGQAVTKFLEACYTLELAERDALACPALLHLLRTSQGAAGSKADIKRVWALHQALLSLPMDPTLSSLLEGTVNRLYLSNPEGHRWLIFLCSLSPDMVMAVHRRAREVLPALTTCKTACQGLGEVYHRAWTVSGGQFRRILEQDVIQDLMYRSVVAPRPLAQAALRVLNVLFVKKTHSSPTAALVTRLLEPILWRHLKVPNELVRQNACELFLASYPLEDPSVSREEREVGMTMQHTALATLLSDPCPNVRASACRGVSSVLAQYWLLVPSHVINGLVKTIVKELASDSSSTKVRLAAVLGIKALLATPASHVYLRKVLPRLADRIHDTNEAVRGAMLELLLTVRTVRSIKFWDVVALDSLLARLEVDKPFICRRIVRLLFKSYLPLGAGEELVLERCIHLVRASRPASRRFYQHAGELPLQEAAKLIVSILSSVRQWVKSLPVLEEDEDGEASMIEGRKSGKRKLGRTQDTVDDTTSSSLTSLVLEDTPGKERQEEEEEHPYHDMEVVWGVLDVACVLWVQHNNELCQETQNNLRSVLEKKAGKCLAIIFKHFRASPACGTVVYLASFLPDRLVQPLASFCTTRVREGAPHWQGAVDSLCNWRRGDELLDLVLEGLRAGLRREEGGGEGGRAVRFAETMSREEGLAVAVRVLEYLLGHHINRAMLLNKCRLQLEVALELCLSVQRAVEEGLASGRELEGREGGLLADLLLLGGQLAVLLGSSTMARLEELLAWGERELCPVTGGETGQPQSRAQVSLAQSVLRSLANLGASSVAIGIADPEFTEKLVDWSSTMLDGQGEAQLSSVLCLLVDTATRAAASNHPDWAVILTEKVLVAFAKVLSWLAHDGPALETGGEGATALRAGVTALLKLYNKVEKEQPECLEDLLEVITEMVVKLVGEQLVESRDVQVPTVLDQLGSVPGALLQAVLSSGRDKQLCRELAKRLEPEVEEGEEPKEVTAATVAAVYVINSGLHGKQSVGVMEQIETVIASLVMVQELEGEEKELLEKVMDRITERRGPAAA